MGYAIYNDYIVYLEECEFNIGIENDPLTFLQARESKHFVQRIYAMKEGQIYENDEAQELIGLQDGRN